MAYPRFFAGQRLTAELLSQMQTQEVTQDTDQTVNNTATLVDSNLTFEAVAGATYWYRLLIGYETTEAADIRMQWTVPTNGSATRFTWGHGIAGTATNANSYTEVSMRTATAPTDTHAGGNSTGTAISYHEEGIIEGGDGGDCTFEFAQTVATAVDTTLTGDSRLLFLRVG